MYVCMYVRTQRNVGVGVQFLRQSGLHGLISDTLVLGVIISFCFRDHKRTRHTQIVIVLNADDGSRFLQMLLQTHGGTLSSLTPRRHAHVNHIDIDRVVEAKMLVGLYHSFNLTQNAFGG